MNTHSQTLIDLALQHIEQGDGKTAAHCLACVLELEPHNLRAHNLRESHALEGNFGSWMGVNAQISPEDDIFRFFVNHPSSKNALRDYLSDGWRTMAELQVVMERHGHVLGQSKSFLEFACGHGRFTRHLAQRLPVSSLSVSDVVPGSVDFLKNLLGVQGFYSTSDPSDLVFPARYQHIFVLSLFSHLPKATWGTWLQRLYAALDSGGLLILSTHGEKCAAQAGVVLDDGYAFFSSSESTAIEGHEYGTSFTSPDFVMAMAHAMLGHDTKMTIHINHFWGNQDAVVIQKI